MKLYRVYSAFLLFFIFSQIAFAQVNSDVKSVLTNIIELSKAKKYEEAGKYIAFYANEKKKDYKVAVLTNKDQLNFVKRIAKKISALAEVSNSFNIGAVTLSKDNGFEFQSVTVEFVSGTQKISSQFKFVTIGGTLLLAEIE